MNAMTCCAHLVFPFFVQFVHRGNENAGFNQGVQSDFKKYKSIIANT